LDYVSHPTVTFGKNVRELLPNFGNSHQPPCNHRSNLRTLKLFSVGAAPANMNARKFETTVESAQAA
jgi:hypothetical protein